MAKLVAGTVVYLLIASAHLLPSVNSWIIWDRLTIDVANTTGQDGTYLLKCHPTGGNHPNLYKACAKLDELTSNGGNPFAPVPADQICTYQYGGPQTASITGFWNKRKVDADFSRTDGCEIFRWNNLVPVLPPV